MSTPGPKTKTPFSPGKRTRIARMHTAGMKLRDIAEKEGVPKGSIIGNVKRYRVQNAGETLPRSGRPRALTEREIRYLIRYVEQNPSVTARELKEKVNLQCCEATIQRELKRRGITRASVSESIKRHLC